MSKDFGKGKTADEKSFLKAQEELKAFLKNNSFADIPQSWIRNDEKEKDEKVLNYKWFDEVLSIGPIEFSNIKRTQAIDEIVRIQKELQRQITDSIMYGLPSFIVKHPKQQGYISNLSYPTDKELKPLNEKISRFLDAGGVIPGVSKQPKKTDTSQHHFDLILSNPHKDIWINEQGEHKISEMHDKHLIAAMRFLIRNFEYIQKAFFKRVEDARKICPTLISKDECWNIGKVNSFGIQGGLMRMIAPYNEMHLEFLRRFGSESHDSILKGN